MKKILFSIIIISIALVGITLVSATDVDAHASDLPIAGSDIRLDDSNNCVVDSDASADLGSTKHPDLWGNLDSLGWHHDDRNPRG